MVAVSFYRNLCLFCIGDVNPYLVIGLSIGIPLVFVVTAAVLLVHFREKFFPYRNKKFES